MSTLSRSASSMAFGTAASRGTGFVRNAALAAVLGVHAVGAAYNVANTTPNIVYELLLGGILTSVVVPVLVRSARSDPDAGEAYAQRLLSLVLVVLLAASVLLVALAPALVELYSPGAGSRQRSLTITWARFFLPQMLFYGAGAVIGAILNIRGRFAAPMWAPVLNNVVVIITCGLFLVLPGAGTLSATTITSAQVGVLGVGTTLGIVTQTIALLPSLRASGFRLRLRLDIRRRELAELAGLAGWVLLFVVVGQIGFVVVVNLSNVYRLNEMGRGYASYVNAYILWQLPHAVVAVSVITALLPRMSRAAADGRLSDLRAVLNRGLRLSIALLVPAAAGFIVLGPALATVVFGHVHTSTSDARFIGVVLAVFAVGMVPYSCFQLQLRAFYALRDTRTPTLITAVVTAALIAVDLAMYEVLPDRAKVLGLAAGHAVSYVLGLLICSRALSRRLSGLDGRLVVRTAVRCVLAACLPALLVAALAGFAPSGSVGSVLQLIVGSLLLGAGYVAAARRLRVTELDEVLAPLLARLRPAWSTSSRRPR